MWINRERYEELVRAEERAEMLRIRVNQLEQENAELRFAVSGRPQRALHLDKPVGVGTSRGKRNKLPGEITIESIEQGLKLFDDMGDDEARAEGLETDGEGRLVG
jgi:hypothetical protein